MHAIHDWFCTFWKVLFLYLLILNCNLHGHLAWPHFQLQDYVCHGLILNLPSTNVTLYPNPVSSLSTFLRKQLQFIS